MLVEIEKVMLRSWDVREEIKNISNNVKIVDVIYQKSLLHSFHHLFPIGNYLSKMFLFTEQTCLKVCITLLFCPFVRPFDLFIESA